MIRQPASYLIAPVILTAALMMPLTADAQDVKPGQTLPEDSAANASTPIGIINHEALDEDVFKFDFAVPSSPALTLLDANKDKLTQSNSLKPFVLSLPNLLSAEETGQSAALDFSPAWLIVKADDRRASAYDAGRSILFRTRLGVALSEGVDASDASDDKPSRIATGLSTSLLSSSDPLLASFPGRTGSAWNSCLNSIPVNMLDAAPTPPFTPEMRSIKEEIDRVIAQIDAIGVRLRSSDVSSSDRARLEAERAVLETTARDRGKALDALQDAFQTTARTDFAKSEAAKYVPICMKAADLAARIGSDLDLGAGMLWSGNPGKFSGLTRSGAVMWASFRTSIGAKRLKDDSWDAIKTWTEKFDRWFMIGTAGRIGLSEIVATGDTARPQIKANTFTAWVGLESYTEASRFAIQAGLQRTSPRLDMDDAFGGTREVFLASFDQQIIDGAWLGVSYGKANGTGALKDDSTLRVNVTFTAPKAKKLFGD